MSFWHRQTQPFHHQHSHRGRDLCLSPSLLSSYIHHPPPALPCCALLSSSPFLCYSLPGSSLGLKHRRRLASQWSNFTAVDADVKRSKKAPAISAATPIPPHLAEGILIELCGVLSSHIELRKRRCCCFNVKQNRYSQNQAVMQQHKADEMGNTVKTKVY